MRSTNMATLKGKRTMTSVYLDPIKLDALKRLSTATGRPMAEHVREGVDLVLDKYNVDVPLPSIPRARRTTQEQEVAEGKADMTRAVIYARYSTDKQAESSIADQVRVCQDYAEAHAMTVTETFADEGISGAALGNRPGARKLMETALAGQLEVVIVADLSRLSRSMADLPKMIDRLVVRDVNVIGVQDGYDSTRKGHKLQAGLQGIIGEQFRDMISERTFSAMESRARERVSTGAKCYGYTTKPVDPNDPNSRKRIITVPNQAEIVREIFERYAEGMTQLAIAQDLNRRGIPSPGSTWKRQSRRCNGWMASGIRVIVNNVRYTE